jgi:hypothetical protein
LQHRARGAGKAVVGDKLAVFRHVQAGRPARIERNGAHHHRRLLAGGFGARQRLANMLRQRAAFLLAAERRRFDTLKHTVGGEGPEFGPVQKGRLFGVHKPGEGLVFCRQCRHKTTPLLRLTNDNVYANNYH